MEFMSYLWLQLHHVLSDLEIGGDSVENAVADAASPFPPSLVGGRLAMEGTRMFLRKGGKQQQKEQRQQFFDAYGT